MKIYHDPVHNSNVVIKMTYEEMLDLRYMLTICYDHLLDDKICVISWGGYESAKNNCNKRCEMNLELRELISGVVDEHNTYMDEMEND